MIFFQITGIRGHGTITGPGQVSVKKEDGSDEIIKAKNILIAVGSEVTPFSGIDVCKINNIECLQIHIIRLTKK